MRDRPYDWDQDGWGAHRYTGPVPAPPAQPLLALPLEEWRRRRIEAGECPRMSCPGQLDDEGACPMCGWSLLEERLRHGGDEAA